MSPAIPSDTRPLIDRLHEAVPGLEWYRAGSAVVGTADKRTLVSANPERRLLCGSECHEAPFAVDMLCPPDDEVVRIVKDWYDKTHPAKSVLERTKELIREAVPGVEIAVQPGSGGTYLRCSVPGSLNVWTVFNDDRTTLERLEEVKDKMAAEAKEALVKPTNNPPSWANEIRALLTADTPDSWLIEQEDGQWAVTSTKHGQKIVVRFAPLERYRLEVREGGAVLPYTYLGSSELMGLAKALCKARGDLASAAESDANELVKEMRAAGFAVGLPCYYSPIPNAYLVTVRSVATDAIVSLVCSHKGWTMNGDTKLYTRSEVGTRVRLALTKTLSEQHEDFERRAREATTQYLQTSSPSLNVPVTAKMRAYVMADSLASHGVTATVEAIDDHAAVCVTDPSTGEVHKAICDPSGNWLMDGEEVYGLVAATELRELGQRQKRKRAKKMDMDKVREMAVNAAYLTAASKVTESMQTLVVAGLMRQLGTDDESTRMKLAAFFASDIGAAFVAGGTGFALQVLPHEEDGRIERLAESLQTSGMAKAMGAAVDVILQPMLGSVQEALKGLPEPPKVRAEPETPAEHEEHHEERAGRKARVRA